MKKTLLAICIAMLVCVMATLAVASGYTSGGSGGQTWITDSLTLDNQSGKGQDKATGNTTSAIAGLIQVDVTVYGTNDNGETVTSSSHRHLDSGTNVSATATAASGTHGYRAISQHKYYHINYGSYTNSIIRSY